MGIRNRDDQDRREYLKWTRASSAGLHRILADEGSLFLNVGATPSNPMLPHEILFELKDLFVFQNTIHWIKAITIETRKGETISAGHFKPLHSKRFLTDSSAWLGYEKGFPEVKRELVKIARRSTAPTPTVRVELPPLEEYERDKSKVVPLPKAP